MKAPRIPVPTSKAISFEIISCANAAIVMPSNSEPTILTVSVPQGWVSEFNHSEIPKRRTAPRAPPIATASHEFIALGLQYTQSSWRTNILKSPHLLVRNMVLWFMTGNEGKVAEAKAFFSKHNITVKRFDFDAVEPQSDDIEIVALAKIEQAIPHLPNADDMLLVEDAGLFVDALNGFPGVYSSYVLETIGNEGVLKLLEHLHNEDPIQDSKLRSASFQAVAVLYMKGQTIVAEGVCPGHITKEKSGENGFGFDPIFIPNDLDADGNALEFGNEGVTSTNGQTFGSISIEEKEVYSHRRRALSSLIDTLSF